MSASPEYFEELGPERCIVEASFIIKAEAERITNHHDTLIDAAEGVEDYPAAATYQGLVEAVNEVGEEAQKQIQAERHKLFGELDQFLNNERMRIDNEQTGARNYKIAKFFLISAIGFTVASKATDSWLSRKGRT
ncbi:hypothetical protein BH23PAT1_BH23PAT1_3950 [soil metagenome]